MDNYAIKSVSYTHLPGLFLESLAGMGGWMDLITIYVSPFGALLVAVCIYFVLGMKDIRAELALGQMCIRDRVSTSPMLKAEALSPVMDTRAIPPMHRKAAIRLNRSGRRLAMNQYRKGTMTQ